jgi:hypothetical protein
VERGGDEGLTVLWEPDTIRVASLLREFQHFQQWIVIPEAAPAAIRDL